MEKFYCEKCRLLYSEMEPCKICGEIASKKIQIEVQNHNSKKS